MRSTSGRQSNVGQGMRGIRRVCCEFNPMIPDTGRFDPSLGREAAFDAADALVVNALRAIHGQLGRPIVAGLCGAQGSGKSTMSARLARHLDAVGLPTAVLSLDDFYLTRAERAAIGRTVHPLLETRGVPGHARSGTCAIDDRILGW